MSFYKELIQGIVGALVLVFVSLALPFILSPRLPLSEKLGLMQVSFNAVAFLAIFVTLVLALAQFRKSMAKPKLEVIFTETNNNEFSINIPQRREITHNLKLSVINKGNAITKLFQIDFHLPSIFQPMFEPTVGVEIPLAYAGISSNPHPISDSTSMLSFYSNEQVYCFVNRPATIHMIKISTRPNEYDIYPSEFTIKYRIYGDWAETQEGKLKVLCKKN